MSAPERERCPRCGSIVDWSQPDPAIWQRADMRAALAARDIATVFRILQRFGWSQRRIAVLTAQSQSEVSEILGGRHVVAYDVLARIADGLGAPRGLMGMAHDTAQVVEGPPPVPAHVDGYPLGGRSGPLPTERPQA